MINRDINPFINDEFDLTKRIIFNEMNSRSSCSIGTVAAINASPVSVDVQPQIKYFDRNEGFQNPPILGNIPIAQMANSLYSFRTPINVGDVGLILWFDREVYTWLLSSSLVPESPDSGTLYNEAACVFIPIMQKFSITPQLAQTGVDIVSANVSLMTQLLSLLSDLTTFCTTVVAAPTTNPLTPVYAAAIAAAATTLNVSIATVTTALTTFKGAQP